MVSARTTSARTSRDNEPPLAELLSEVTSQVQVLLRKEVELAKAEAGVQISRAAKGGAAFGVAGALGFAGLITLLAAGAWGLTEVIAPGWAFLAMAVLALVIAGAVAAVGIRKIRQFSPVPHQTVQTVKEDVETAKDSLQRGVSEPVGYDVSGSEPYDPWRRY